jgi:hypothetical protein
VLNAKREMRQKTITYATVADIPNSWTAWPEIDNLFFSLFLFGVKGNGENISRRTSNVSTARTNPDHMDKKDVETAEALVKAIPDLEALSEPKARLIIQKIIEEQDLKAHILFDGNTVWNSRRILSNLKRIMEHGTLYNRKKPRYVPIGSMLRMPVVGECILSDYFYNFLHLCCGSIAHYNKQGWVTEYPTVEDLKAFFQKNEFGHRVLDDIPDWETDAKRVVEEIERMLYPLKSFMKDMKANQNA